MRPGEAKYRGTRLHSFLIATRALGSWDATMWLREKETQPKTGSPARVSLVRHGKGWGRGCSQTPGHPDTTGNYKDLRT